MHLPVLYHAARVVPAKAKHLSRCVLCRRIPALDSLIVKRGSRTFHLECYTRKYGNPN